MKIKHLFTINWIYYTPIYTYLVISMHINYITFFILPAILFLDINLLHAEFLDAFFELCDDVIGSELVTIWKPN